MRDLQPPDMDEAELMPFLAVGDDDLGSRNVVFTGRSDLSGEFVVEEVDMEDEDEGGVLRVTVHRRLVFASNKMAIMSEARLVEAATLAGRGGGDGWGDVGGVGGGSGVGSGAGGGGGKKKNKKGGKKKGGKKGGAKKGGAKKKVAAAEGSAEGNAEGNAAAGIDAEGSDTAVAVQGGASGGNLPEGFVFDFGVLTLEYQTFVVSGLAFVRGGGAMPTAAAAAAAAATATAGGGPTSSSGPVRVLLLGLGGGPLAMFMHQYFPQIVQETVELDKVIEEVAREWFGFAAGSAGASGAGGRGGSRLTSYVADALEFVRERSRAIAIADAAPAANVLEAAAAAAAAASASAPAEAGDEAVGGKAKDAGGASGEVAGGAGGVGGAGGEGERRSDMIIIDIDAKDHSSGIMFPPASFLDAGYLAAIHTCLCSDGVLVINLASRSASKYAEALSTIRSVFAQVYVVSVGGDSLNVVIFALPEAREKMSLAGLRAAAGQVAGSATGRWSDSIDLPACFDTVRVEDSDLAQEAAAGSAGGKGKAEEGKRRKKRGGKKKN